MSPVLDPGLFRVERVRIGLATLARSFGNYNRSLTSTWASHLANVIVAAFMAPFVVHTLGDAQYGVWSLLISLTGYLGLVDIGVRVSTGRYINYYRGRGEDEKAFEVISTSLVVFSGISLFVLIGTLIVGYAFPVFFSRVPHDLARQARWILPMLGFSMWLSFFSSTFAQILQANGRFDAKNLVDVSVLAVRTLMAVVLLRRWGLIGLSLSVLVAACFECIAMYWAARSKGFPFRLGRQYVQLRAAREISTFGLWSFVANVSSRIINYTDVVLIGLLLRVEAITVYSIGFMLVDYATSFMSQIVGVMTPDVYQAAGRHDIADLKKLVVRGAHLTMLFSTPLLVGLMVDGRDFIALWMGPSYRDSGWITLMLAFSQFGVLASRAGGASLWGFGRVIFLARMAALEATLNAVLSVVLATSLGLGIYGIALGTAIPMIALNWFVLPANAYRELGLSLRDYLRSILAPWLSAAVALGCFGVWLNVVFPTTSWFILSVKVIALCLAYVPIALIAAAALIDANPTVARDPEGVLVE